MARLSLHNHTLNLVVNRPRKVTLEEIASNCEVKVSWLRRFITGSIKHPDVDSVQSVYTYLSGKTLDV